MNKPVCNFDGCNATLSKQNVTGRCADHVHKAGCGCKFCTGRMEGKKPLGVEALQRALSWDTPMTVYQVIDRIEEQTGNRHTYDLVCHKLRRLCTKSRATQVCDDPRMFVRGKKAEKIEASAPPPPPPDRINGCKVDRRRYGEQIVTLPAMPEMKSGVSA